MFRKKGIRNYYPKRIIFNGTIISGSFSGSFSGSIIFFNNIFKFINLGPKAHTTETTETKPF